MEYKVILDNIRESSFRRPWIYLFILFFLTYLAFNIWLNKFYVILPSFFSYRKIVIIASIISTLTVSSLIAINLNLLVAKIKAARALSSINTSGFTALGIFSGLLGGICPGCFVGLFPIIAVAVGSTAISLSSLPLLGQEFQIVAALLLIPSIIYIGKQRNICKIKRKNA